MNLTDLSVLRKYLSVQSHKTGTISLKIAISALSDPKVKEIIATFKGQTMPKAILDTKVNIFTQTLTIKYDSNVITPQDFEELLTTQNENHFLQLAETYHAKLLA